MQVAQIVVRIGLSKRDLSLGLGAVIVPRHRGEDGMRYQHHQSNPLFEPDGREVLYQSPGMRPIRKVQTQNERCTAAGEDPQQRQRPVQICFRAAAALDFDPAAIGDDLFRVRTGLFHGKEKGAR